MRTIRSAAIRLRPRSLPETNARSYGGNHRGDDERAMIAFKLLVSLCGLTLRETAAYVGAGNDTARSWSSGRNRCPDNVISRLRELAARQERAARRILLRIAKLDTRPAGIVLYYPADDEQARAIDWPCVNAWSAMAARIVAGTSMQVLLTPSPPSLAAATFSADISDGMLRIPLPQGAAGS